VPNFAYTSDAAAYTYQGTGTVMGSGSDVAYGMPGVIHGKAHLSVIGWVLLAVVGLVLLDKGGFKFMFLAGKG
jgi:hypothetical protein